MLWDLRVIGFPEIYESCGRSERCARDRRYVWDVREVNLAQWSLTDRAAIATKETNFVT